MMKLALFFCMLVVGGHSQQPNTTVCCACEYEQGYSKLVNGTVPSGSNSTMECLRTVCPAWALNPSNSTAGFCGRQPDCS